MARRKRAYRQGDLDALCGVYSIVNALRYVFHLRDEQCQKLFGKLIKALERDCGHLYQPVLHGMDLGQLKRLLNSAGQVRILGRNLKFEARTLRLKRNQRTLPHLWAALDQELKRSCVAIVWITGATDHWCVVYRVTPKTLWLLDSDGCTYMGVALHGSDHPHPLLPRSGRDPVNRAAGCFPAALNLILQTSRAKLPRYAWRSFAS